MDQPPVIEDERGVDVSQIRQLLHMTVADRVAEMVRVCNMVLQVQQNVHSSTSRQAG